MEPDPASQVTLDQVQAIVNAAVRTYATRLAQRLLPFAVAVISLALVTLYLPSKSPTSASASSDSPTAPGNPGGNLEGGATPGQSATPGNVNTTGGDTTGSGAATTTTTGPLQVGGTGPSGTGRQPGQGQFAASNIAVSGVKCGPGVKQVLWEPYAPPCLPAWSGNNGGATAHGVTATTITFTYTAYKDMDTFQQCDCTTREQNQLKAWIGVFNKNFELYGRHIVLKVINSSGSGALMFDNQDQQHAAQDAQTAYDAGSFADIGQLTLPPYIPALAAKHIMFGGVEYMGPDSARQYAPYAYGNPFWYAGTNWGQAAVATICKRMAGMPAIFSTDAVIQKTVRKFGLVYPDSPDWSTAGKYIIDHAGGCGVQFKTATYNPALSAEASQATQIIAQMRAAGVTTIVDPSDPLMMGLLAQSADKQSYYPEWMPGDNITSGWRDYYSPAQLSAVIRQSVQPHLQGPAADQGCRVMKMAKATCYPDGDTLYYVLLNFLRGIQAAGPNLTPATFAAGLQRLPDATGGYGLWSTHRPLWQNPQADFVLAHWSPGAKAADGKVGDFAACNGGARYRFDAAMNAIGSGQLRCPS